MMDIEEYEGEAKRISHEYGIDIKVCFVNDKNTKKKLIQDGHTLTFNLCFINPNFFDDYFWSVLRDEIMPFLCYETHRLIIRRVKAGDSLDIFEMTSDEEGCLADGFESFLKMDTVFENYMKNLIEDQTRYAIELKDSHQVIGLINMMKKDDRALEYFEIGYAIHQRFWRQGYGYEAISKMLQVARLDLHIPMMTASVFKWNEKSQKMLEKLHFKKEGILHKAAWHERYSAKDLVSYVIDLKENVQNEH